MDFPASGATKQCFFFFFCRASGCMSSCKGLSLLLNDPMLQWFFCCSQCCGCRLHGAMEHSILFTVLWHGITLLLFSHSAVALSIDPYASLLSIDAPSIRCCYQLCQSILQLMWQTQLFSSVVMTRFFLSCWWHDSSRRQYNSSSRHTRFLLLLLLLLVLSVFLLRSVLLLLYFDPKELLPSLTAMTLLCCSCRFCDTRRVLVSCRL